MKKIFSFLSAILFAGALMATEVSVTIHASSGDYYAKANGWENGTQYSQVILDDNITANLVGTGNNGKYYSDWRFYTNGSDEGSFSIDAAEGYQLQSVTFEFSVSNSGALYMGETKLTSKTAVDVSGSKAVFQCKNTNSATNGQVKLTKISVTYDVMGVVPPVEDAVYTVVGGSDALFGEKWNPALAYNDMSKANEGYYVWSKANVALPGGEIEYKVVRDHSWDGEQYPASGNYAFVLPETASYNVTITLYPGDKAEAVWEKAGDVVIDPTAAVLGEFNSWDETAGTMVLSEDKKTASLDVTLAAGDYAFKMYIDGGWRSNAYTFNRDFTSADGITSNNNDNMVLKADVDGVYTFTWAFEPSALAITFPEKSEPVDPNQMYIWDGSGAKEEDAIEKGGKAEAVQADGTNIVVGASQKGNWCLKANKGFNSGKYYIGIALDNAVNAGDQIVLGFFRTGSGSTYVLGMDFSADKESASTDYQILTTDDPEVLTSNGVPSDVTFNVPEGVKDAKYIRIYRNSGSTGLWVSKFAIVKGGEVPPVVEDKYYMKNNWDNGSEWYWKEMEKDSESAYKLANVVFGGTGVNWNTVAADEGQKWVELADIVVSGEEALEAKDTLDFILDLAAPAPVVRAQNIRKFADGGDVPPVTEDKYYMKNNWDNGSEWYWKEMEKDSESAYKLANVVFGGTGVNWKQGDNGIEEWVPVTDIVVPEGIALEAKDTLDFILEIDVTAAPVVRAQNIRKFADGGDVPPVGTPLYYITGESLVGSWEPNALPVYQSIYEFESVKAGSYSFKITVDGTWATAKGYDDLTLKQDGLSADNDGNICFTLAEDGPVSVLYTDAEFMVRGNFVVPEPPVSEWDEIIFKETDIADKGQTAKSFVSDTNEKFVLSVTDDDSKIAIDANPARFGTPVLYSMYHHRLKTGGKSSTKNALSLAIPADGQLRIAVRTGSNSATDRTLVLKQNDVELFNSVIQESDAQAVDEDGTEVKVYPYVTVNVTAGNVAVEYPVNGLYFYEFGFKVGDVPPVEEHTYSLVGPLSPAGWDEKSEKGDMTLVDGVYVFKLENVELVAGTKYEYKIVEDHSWNVAFPQSGNADFTVDKSGIYNVTFSLDAVTKEYAAVPELIEEIVVVPSVAMHGNFTGGWGDTDNFTVSDDEQSASLTLTLGKGSYEFGMRIGGKNNWMSNGVEFTRENPSAVVEAGSGNLKLAADVEGEYTFTWIFERSTLVITFPEAGPVEDPTVAVIGSMTQWQEAIPFVLSEDKKSAVLNVDKIPVGDYEFKLLINGQYRSNGYEFHRDFHACAGISENAEANMILKVDTKGEFTFEWFFENDSLNIIFPEKSEIPDLYIKNNWGGAEEWSWKQMTYEVVEGNSVYYVMDVVFGGSGVNLNGKPSDEDALWIPVDKIQAFTPAQEKTELQALDTVMFVYYPAYEMLAAIVTGPYNAPQCEFEDGLYIVGTMNNWEMSKDYMLQINSDAEGTEFWCELTLHEGDEFKILWWSGCKAAAWIPGGEQNIVVTREYAGKIRVYVRPEGNPEWPEKYYYIEVVQPENINNTEANTKVVKMLENGQLFIQKGGKTYNVLGTLVK